ncbi:MAG: DVU0524 family FlgM-associated protein [Thermodesulfobacteriota bacterium]|nr:DVU0524 family FlgM-associated protein [Thermodesulfobacteriota bacterium]
MVISAYQVNNVLRVYGDQLRQSRISTRSNHANTRAPDTINISAEAKRKAIVDKIANDIVDKITQYDPQDSHNNIKNEVSKELGDEYGINLAINRKSPNDLIFKVIDENGETTNSLSIEDSRFSRYKLGKIAT